MSSAFLCASSSPASSVTPLLHRIGASLKKPLVGIALGVFALTSQAADVTSMKIGTVAWIGYGPFYVAEKLDMFKKYNLKVSLQMFSDPALIPPAIASGAVAGGMLTYDQVVGQVAAGRMQKVVMPIDYSNGGDAIVSDMSITKVTDLKGKKVGYNPLSPSDFLLSYALKANGMTDKDITSISMTPEAVPAAMASGQMQVGVTYEPSLSQIISQGGGKKFKVLFSSKEAPGMIADVLVFDEKVIKAKPTEIAGIIKAYLDGMEYMKTKPDEAAKIIGKALGVSAKDVKEQLSGVYNIPLAEMPKAFVKSSETTSYFASGEIIGQILKNKGQITTIPATEATFDAQFVTALTKK
jgi:NitT/TauT family transport system substrate-binding protein